MAITLNRTTFTAATDDSGSGTDGTPVDKDFIADVMLDPVDAALATIGTSIDDSGRLSLAPSTELTIASGVVTVVGNRHSIDTEANAASDDLDTLTAGTNVEDGHVVILKAENAARVVTVKDGTGNILLKGGNFAMNDAKHRLYLMKDGASWYELARNSGGGTPGGSDTQVQFNDGGNLGGDAGFTYNKTTDALTLAGLLNISGAAAGQVKFPATQNASADANTLDDYAEGSWTPVIGGSGGTSGQAYGAQTGRYTKIGRVVHIQANVTLSTKGTITGNVQIQGLPFAVGTSQATLAVVMWDTLAVAKLYVQGVFNFGTTTIALYGLAAANVSSNATTIAAADIANTTTFYISGSYLV